MDTVEHSELRLSLINLIAGNLKQAAIKYRRQDGRHIERLYYTNNVYNKVTPHHVPDDLIDYMRRECGIRESPPDGRSKKSRNVRADRYDSIASRESRGLDRGLTSAGK